MYNPGVSVVKYECIGHVQQRVRVIGLRKLKKTVKGVKWFDGQCH